jgi:hypothetical protein
MVFAPLVVFATYTALANMEKRRRPDQSSSRNKKSRAHGKKTAARLNSKTRTP